jgi:hypothetical protein
VYLQAQKWGYELSTTEAAHIAEAALEAQSAPLLADSREALAQWFGSHERIEFDGRVVVVIGDEQEAADDFLASGVVSLTADRDRATAERGWEEGFHAAGLLFGLVPQRDLARRNPYRESEEQA